MSDHRQKVLKGAILEEQSEITLDEIGRICAVRRESVVALVDVVLASPGETLATLCRDTPSVQGTSSREEVVEILETHRVGSLRTACAYVADSRKRAVSHVHHHRVSKRCRR